MPSKSEEHYKYVWASLIVREYEKAASRAGVDDLNRELIQVKFLGPMEAMKMAVNSAEKAINGESIGTAKSALSTGNIEGNDTGGNRPPHGQPASYSHTEWELSLIHI